MELDDQTKQVVLEWMGKFVPAPLHELSGLLADPIRHWRWNNQFNFFVKSRQKCLDNNIKTKIIPTKLVYSLLDLSSIEDDELLQDKWANLFTNMLDSEQNIQNHVLPYLLSQISRIEYEKIISHYWKLTKGRVEIPIELKEIERKLEKETKKNLRKVERDRPILSQQEIFTLTWGITDAMSKLHAKQSKLRKDRDELNDIGKYLDGIEIDNLVRLGLIVAIAINSATSEMKDPDRSAEIITNISCDGFDYELTELGFQFIHACEEVKCKKPN